MKKHLPRDARGRFISTGPKASPGRRVARPAKAAKVRTTKRARDERGRFKPEPKRSIRRNKPQPKPRKPKPKPRPRKPQPKPRKPQPKPRKPTRQESKRITELEIQAIKDKARIAELESKIQPTRIRVMPEVDEDGWIDPFEIGWHKGNGSWTPNYSRVRFHKNAPQLWELIQEASYKGPITLEREIARIADKLKVQIREVWSFFMSW